MQCTGWILLTIYSYSMLYCLVIVQYVASCLVYCTLFNSGSEDRIINFIMGHSLWYLNASQILMIIFTTSYVLRGTINPTVQTGTAFMHTTKLAFKAA